MKKIKLNLKDDKNKKQKVTLKQRIKNRLNKNHFWYKHLQPIFEWFENLSNLSISVFVSLLFLILILLFGTFGPINIVATNVNVANILNEWKSKNEVISTFTISLLIVLFLIQNLERYRKRANFPLKK